MLKQKTNKSILSKSKDKPRGRINFKLEDASSKVFKDTQSVKWDKPESQLESEAYLSDKGLDHDITTMFKTKDRGEAKKNKAFQSKKAQKRK